MLNSREIIQFQAHLSGGTNSLGGQGKESVCVDKCNSITSRDMIFKAVLGSSNLIGHATIIMVACQPACHVEFMNSRYQTPIKGK